MTEALAGAKCHQWLKKKALRGTRIPELNSDAEETQAKGQMFVFATHACRLTSNRLISSSLVQLAIMPVLGEKQFMKKLAKMPYKGRQLIKKRSLRKEASEEDPEVGEGGKSEKEEEEAGQGRAQEVEADNCSLEQERDMADPGNSTRKRRPDKDPTSSKAKARSSKPRRT